MLEGIYFQFPKLGFLLFFFLACEALCPLRSNALYYPNTARFGDVGVKPALWMWVAKWAMIMFLIIALMSPVKEKSIAYQGGGGYDILLIVDPLMIDAHVIREISAFIDKRSGDAIALWIPEKPEVAVPLTYEYPALKSILSQTRRAERTTTVNTKIRRFFDVSAEAKRWTIIFSQDPKTFIHSLPVGDEVSISPYEKIPQWIDTMHRTHPLFVRYPQYRYVDYYYVYPLFLGFMAMLVYLYGRNQKGLK